jgi:hypothetical protein
VITKEMLRIYQRFRGDVDGFSRGGTRLEKAAMPDDAWGEIGVLLQSLGMVERGLASPVFAAEVDASLSRLAADAGAREEILRMVHDRT